MPIVNDPWLDTLDHTEEHHWDGPNSAVYTALLSFYDYRMEFKVYRANRATDGSLVYTDFEYHVEDCTLANAETWVEGAVKWDGCCNFTLEKDGVMAHICGVQSMHDLAMVFDRLYAAAATMPKWDH